jgi:hypothetical protein
MGYYMGDYYAGARGDPGIGSFLGGLFSSAASFIPGVGPIVSKGISAITRVGGAATAGRSVVKAGKGIIMKHPVLTAAGAAGGLAVAAHELGVGHRKCKHVNPRTGKCRRRMNVCNPRALRRSIRRTHGFAKLAMRTIHLVHPKKKVKFGGFRKKKSHK